MARARACTTGLSSISTFSSHFFSDHRGGASPGCAETRAQVVSRNYLCLTFEMPSSLPSGQERKKERHHDFFLSKLVETFFRISKEYGLYALFKIATGDLTFRFGNWPKGQ